jgi:hypothetical protein
MEDADKVAYEEIKKMSSQGIFPQDKLSFEDMLHRRIAVRVEVMLPEKADVKPLNWNVEVMNKRGCSVILSDWGVDQVGEQKVLTFTVSMPLPDNVVLDQPNRSATSFADLCWLQGNEAIAPTHAPDVTTKVRDSHGYNDLGWFLPCRFADRLIDALGKANDFFLSGVLEDALIYGPAIKEKKV